MDANYKVWLAHSLKLHDSCNLVGSIAASYPRLENMQLSLDFVFCLQASTETQ